MAKIIINDQPVEVSEGTTVLSAAESVGISIPHLCFHPAFPPEGSCRICLVEIENLPKLELACSTRVREGMKIWTNSERVVEARKSVLEFLLAEHPLDCPICDKAGECKLQDYYEAYGLFDSAFRETKIRKNKKVAIGKGLILDRERCILCTRCLRFLCQVTKSEELGIFNRGLKSEISPYNGDLIDNNYAGNLTELCPVGAITHEDFRFKIRTWFLERGDSICPLCSRGCQISIEYHPGFARVPRKKRVYRVVSRENHGAQGSWICDIGRYGYAYLDEERPGAVVFRNSGKEQTLDWESALQLIVDRVKNLHIMKKTKKIAVIANSSLSNEELFLIKKLFHDDLSVDRIFVVDPPDGEGDGFLLTPERSPNRRGAQELGFDFRQANLGDLAEETEVLFIFGHFLTGRFSLAEIKEAFDSISLKVLFAPATRGLGSVADLVFPTAHIAEKAGSLTNIEGEIQHFSAALTQEGESRPEWQALLRLAVELKIHIPYYSRLTSPSLVFEQLGKEIRFFKKET